MRKSLSAAAVALLLTGCSGGTNAGAQTSSNQQAGTAEAVPADPPVAAASGGPEKPDCSSVPQSDSRSDNDIAGIDIGMSADDALRIAKCNKEGFEVEVSDDDTVTLPDGSHPRGGIRMKKDNDQIDLFLVGAPGREKVYGLMRGTIFPEGQEPTMEQMRAGLVQKYSPLRAQVIGDSRYENTQVLALTPDGQRLPDDKASDCTFTFGQRLAKGRNSLAQLKEECGFTKKFDLLSKSGNDSLVGEFSLWIADQNGFFKQAREEVAEIRAIQADAQEAERQKAASSNRTPNL